MQLLKNIGWVWTVALLATGCENLPRDNPRDLDNSPPTIVGSFPSGGDVEVATELGIVVINLPRVFHRREQAGILLAPAPTDAG